MHPNRSLLQSPPPIEIERVGGARVGMLNAESGKKGHIVALEGESLQSVVRSLRTTNSRIALCSVPLQERFHTNTNKLRRSLPSRRSPPPLRRRPHPGLAFQMSSCSNAFHLSSSNSKFPKFDFGPVDPGGEWGSQLSPKLPTYLFLTNRRSNE